MIKVIHYQNEAAEKSLESIISANYDEVRKLLPKLPKKIRIYFGDYGIVPETGIGGFAYAHDIITISIDPNFKDRKKQLKDIRPTIFHESFHIFQNNYREWKFFHPKLKERWIVYKTGTWITDKVLQKTKLNIVDLSAKPAAEVLDLYDQ